jgi:iron complex outermembrane receptor protein
MKDAGFLRFCGSRLVGASRHSSALIVLIILAASPFARAEELADLSLEELANLEVTSVSRRAERLADAPASLFVITGEDIRRSGVTSLPEALRLAPNLEVARIDARQYAISARGFNNSVANKLLVLIDGRTIYTPLYSGVFWDAQDTFLEDIERIEVISGPGATLWGANAVNGVINIITRRATSTVGTVAEAGFGNRERGVAARQGFALDGGALRVYGKFFDRSHTVLANGAAVPDEWHNGQAGFRGDWGTAASGFTLQGDAYRGSIQQATLGDIRISGGNLLGRWNRQLGSADRLQVQAYIDNTTRDMPGTFGERLNTVDLDVQHGFQATAGQSVTWGGGHRRSYDQVSNTAMLAFLPASTTLKWTNIFLQDEIELHEQLRLTVGGKIESNPYTGREFLPSIRLAWKPESSQLVWGAVSRAVRAPSRLDRELFIPGQPPFFLAGGPDFRSEVAKVFELGYRAQPSQRLSYSVTSFYAVYDRLRSVEPAAGGALVFGNKMQGKTKGIETWGTYQVSSSWRLSAGAVFLTEELRLRPDSGDTSGIAAAGNDPKHQYTLRSSHDLSSEQQLDLMARHVGELPNPRVPAYTAIDARFGWRFRRDLEFSATAQNIFDRRHPEFGTSASRSEIERGIFLRLKWSP